MTTQSGVTREQAQARADRIRACREELAAAESDGALTLTDTQRAALDAYHDNLLTTFSARFDVDRSPAEHHLSLGMRIVTFFGAVALTAAAVLFFRAIWGLLPSAGQIAVVWAAPLAALWGASATARRERTHYFTLLLALLAFGCFALDVSVLGTVLNARESPMPLLAGAAFALAVAYAWNLRLLLAVGTVCAIGFCAAVVMTWSHLPWDVFFGRPEVVIAPAAFAAMMSAAPLNAGRDGFPSTLRLTGFGTIAIAVISLSSFGELSRLPLSPRTAEHVYQIVGFVFAAALIGMSFRRGWPESLNQGAALFGLLLLLRYADWWWDWMPKYLFFLIVGATALACMFLLRRLRLSAAEATR
jgi:hypothetical protein